MKTKTITLYDFDELTPESQEKAIQNLSDINVDYEWWEYEYEDAEQIGLKITGFNLDSLSIYGEFINSAFSCAELILQNHGEDSETHKTALKYIDGLKLENSEFYKDNESEFLSDILEDYRIILQQEYDFRISREQIIETIKANEYTFTSDGKLENI